MVRKLKDFALPLSSCLLVIGTVMVSCSVIWYLSYIHRATFPAELSALQEMEKLGDWGWWLLITSPFVFIAGSWYFIDCCIKRRRFRALISTGSKAGFIKALPELEKLALSLPRKYSDGLEAKKKDFKL
ncbi:MAG: DUF3198 domain-containing protein [Candidatus Thermoplasmatota archaeon]|nr:DUF3198 domain-containing protein [Candidatus Thermoplasmatota archaeon]